jgi:hypothetical protein
LVRLGSFDTTSANNIFPNVTINHDHHVAENIARIWLELSFLNSVTRQKMPREMSRDFVRSQG